MTGVFVSHVVRFDICRNALAAIDKRGRLSKIVEWKVVTNVLEGTFFTCCACPLVPPQNYMSFTATVMCLETCLDGDYTLLVEKSIVCVLQEDYIICLCGVCPTGLQVSVQRVKGSKGS